MRVRRLLLRITLIVALFAVLAAVLVRGLVVSEPGWYKPIVFAESELASQQQRLSERIISLRNEVGRSQVRVASATDNRWPAFEIEFTEAEINATLQRWQVFPQFSPSDELREPHIRFLPGRAEFAARAGENGPLLSMELSVEQTEQGPQVTLGRPWAGRMPLARSLVERAREKIIAEVRQQPVPEATIRSLDALLAGESIAPIVAVPSSVVNQRDLLPARVEALTIEEGKLKATLRPFDPKSEPLPTKE